MNIIFAFPFGRKKTIANHPEQFCSGGNWSLVHSLRLLGNNVHVINLYNDNEQFDDAKAAIEFERVLEMHPIRYDALAVFDFGNSRVKWKQISEASKKQVHLLIYHAGDDPMRFDANIATIKAGQFNIVLAAQKPFVKKYREHPGLYLNKVEWMPYFHDGILHYTEYYEPSFDIVHCGKIYGAREEILKKFIESGFSVDIRQAWGHNYRQALSSARYGWHEAWCGEVGYRHFEIPAMGKILICDRLDESYGLDELLPDCVYYQGKTPGEKAASAIDTLKYLSTHELEMRTTQRKMTEHVLKMHGPLARANQLTDLIKG